MLGTHNLYIAYAAFGRQTQHTRDVLHHLKNILIYILTLIGFATFGQENKLDQINNEVNSIELDSTLMESEFDWTKLTGIATDGGGILKIWRNDTQICKIREEIGLSYGRVKTIIYLDGGIPIKIIETENNFGHDNGKLNYQKLNEVFNATIYIFDWENDKSEIERIGKRVLSEGSCSTFDYEPILELAKNTIK